MQPTASSGPSSSMSKVLRLRRPGVLTVLVAIATLLASSAIFGSPLASAATGGAAVLGPATLVSSPGSPITDRTDAPPPQPTTGPARFAPPPLANPVTIEVSATNRDLRLDPSRDYIVKMPSTPLESPGGLQITGGHNVVLIGGEVHHPRWWSTDPKLNRGLYLVGQTGTIHIEGLYLSGVLSEGINLSQTKGAVVQLVNIRVDTVQGSQSSNHADVIQTWAGPRKLLIDGLSGSTTYQGFFLLPNQHFDGPQPELFDFSRIDLQGGPDSGYLLWTDLGFPVRTSDVWVSPNPSKASNPDNYLWPKASTLWSGVQSGMSPGGQFVTAADAGVGYVARGYAS